MAAPPKIPPISPPVADGDSVLPYTGDEDGDADITTAEMGMLVSKLKEATIAVVDV